MTKDQELLLALRERNEARAEVERLRACSAEQGEQYAAAVLRFASELRIVAERQREADQKAFATWLREVHATGLPHETPEVLADAVDDGEVLTPLVTEGET